MDSQTKISLLAYFLLIMLDKVIVSDARRLLLDFLIGQRNRKNAKRIHAEQHFMDRVTMAYIAPMLTKHQKAYRIYHILYLIILYSLIPQYVGVVLIHIWLPGLFRYVICALLLIRFLLAFYYRLELGPNRASVYAQKKK